MQFIRRPARVLAFFCTCVCIYVASASALQLGSRPAEEWVKTLENPQRIANLKIDDVVARLRLRPGTRVADIGSGAGAFVGALATAVSPGGVVYAVDIEQGLLDHIAERARTLNLTNVQVVLGKFTDPGLPAQNIDVALIYDVLHHIEAREEYLKNLGRYIAADGRIAVVDFHPGRGGHVDQPAQQISKEQAALWMANAGFKRAEEVDLFADKWFVIYSR
jgi:ubiquinone/menaquinone biosynthesis C-methylase UbiE